MTYSATALALRDHPLVREMLVRKAPEVGYIETSGPLADSIAAMFPKQPLLLHNSIWDWSLAHPEALQQREVIPCTLRSLRRTRAPWLSVHLGFSATDLVFKAGMGFQPRSNSPLSRDGVFTNICRNVRALATGIPVPLFLENLDYNPGGAYEHICRPDFISAVVNEAEVGFLLDLAHARISAARLGFSITDYLKQLPLERTRQMHVSGARMRGKTMVDAHEPLLEEDYELLQDILQVTTPLALTLEYGKDEVAIREQLTWLRHILESHSAANHT